ncbi:hypothetical protein BH10PSE17_BH10PSE17_32440 [soil metagenome]
MIRMARLALLATLTALAACSVTPVRMVVPSELTAGVERIEIKGLGSRGSGSFRSSAGNGSFERSADRLVLFNDVALLDRALARFAFDGKSDAASGECRMERNSLAVGIANVTMTQPLVYRCAFVLSPGGAASTLTLREEEAGRSGLQSARRAGVVDYGVTQLTIESVNAIQGSSLLLAQPIGYLFKIDGRTVGAVDLADAPVAIVRDGTSADARRAIILSSLALGLLWDPAP